MDTQLQTFQWTRQNILNLIDNLSLEQMNMIPDGFNNSILWNAGHIHWVQQILVYRLAGLPTKLSDDYSQKYATGSSPKRWVLHEELDQIRSFLEDFSLQTPKDHQQGMFEKFTPLNGSYGIINFQLNTWQESFQYNNIHEAWHLGYMMALRNAIK